MAYFQRTNQLVEKTPSICVKKNMAWVMPVLLSCRASSCSITSKAYRRTGFNAGWFHSV